MAIITNQDDGSNGRFDHEYSVLSNFVFVADLKFVDNILLHMASMNNTYRMNNI